MSMGSELLGQTLLSSVAAPESGSKLPDEHVVRALT